MIGVIDVAVQAANISMPLYPLRAFVNSPSSLRIRNVPKRIGDWNISSVQLVVSYPDNTVKTVECKLIGNVWVGTVAGSSIIGRCENGYTVFASGNDENGNPVSNYVLGKGLVEILEADGTITPGADITYVHLYDEEPDQPKEGDMWQTEDGYVIWQDGEEHRLGISSEEVSTMISDKVPDIVTEKVEVGVGDNWRNYINETRKPYWDSDFNIWMWEDIEGNPLESSASEDTIELVFNGTYLGATIKLLLTGLEVFGEPGEYEYIMRLVFSDGTEHEFTYKDSVGYFTYNGTDYYPQGDVSQWALDNYHTFEVEGGITFKFYRDSAMRNALGLATYDELETVANQVSSKQDKLNTTQLSAVNSNITAAKVAGYDDALTKFNYKFHTAIKPDPYVPSNVFPIEYSASGETFTINESDSQSISIQYGGSNIYYLEHNNSMFGVGIKLCYINMDGTFNDYIDVNNVTFHGTSPTQNVTQIAVIPQGYVLMDRAVNTINITPEFSTYNLEFPSAVQGKARDFIIRAVASAGAYSTPPTLSASGVTLMNAEGTMPEIATDENAAKTTLVYFSEIASNTFLVKGEALETIS